MFSGLEENRLDQYEKAFVEHVARLNLEGSTFAALVRQAMEAEYGGEINNLLSGIKQQTFENPKKFAKELSKTFGETAMRYFVTIIKFAESGRFQPEEDLEQQKADEDFESLVRETEPASDQQAEGY
ncbi:MAG: hypothetical protein OK452_04545 [Thaumarchaeota archaeon]|nr:hypothetical protein [Nitrososphaerota archaeon]